MGVLLCCVVWASAQRTSKVTGNLCGADEGMHAGTIALSVGGKVIKIGHTFSMPIGMREPITRYSNSGPPFGNDLGKEFTVVYKIIRGHNEAVSIHGTGKFRRVAACTYF